MGSEVSLSKLLGSTMQISNFKISTVNGLRRVIVLAVGGARFKVFKFLGLEASNARVWVVAAKGFKI